MKYTPQPVPKKADKIAASENESSRTVRGGKIFSDDEKIESMWNTWCNATKRPDEESILTEDIQSELMDSARTIIGFPVEFLNYTARAASYISPVKGDKKDIQRLINCCINSQTRKNAVNAMNSLSPKPYFWMNDKELSSIMDSIASRLKSKPYDELSDKEQSALVALANMPSADVRVLIDSAWEEYGKDVDYIKPSHIIVLGQRSTRQAVPRSMKNKKQPYQMGNKGTVYAEGRQEDEVLFDDGTLDYDTYAMDLLVNGYSRDSIVEYHKSMPPGYWKNVVKVVEETGTSDLENVYQSLYDHYRMHPKDRDMPDLF